MDEINDFFRNARAPNHVALEGAASGSSMSRMSHPPLPEPLAPAVRPSTGTSYVQECLRLDDDSFIKKEEEDDDDDDDADSADKMDDVVLSDEDEEIFDKYNLQNRTNQRFQIDEMKSEILHSIKNQSVTIIEGPTGCGKSTQVPMWILKDCYKNRQHCNIIVTQPRRIAAIFVAKRVCEENDVELGDLIGYQIGLDKKNSLDTRLTYVTTGVLLQSLVKSKNLRNFTHIILDEVHERAKDMDFLMIILRKLLKTNSKGVKLILMSATFNADKFSEYFATKRDNNVERIPVISLSEKREFTTHIHYLDDLWKFNKLPTIDVNSPGISNEGYEVVVKLLNAFEMIDEKDERDSADKHPCVLIFLPGYSEIERLYHILNDDNIRNKISPQSAIHKLWLVPLHSTITTNEQAKAFANPPQNYRKVILATNIAESSITVPDIKYVIDFCLMKLLNCNPTTNFSSLQLSWASQTSCKQRAGRAGRVRSGRVYRLVSRDFYEELPEDTPPELQRNSLETLILNAKILDMGPPKYLLALAMDPPDLDNIHRTVLVLKEMGALYNDIKYTQSSFEDGEITYIGRVMAKLPLDVRVSKLILFGYMFGCLEDCIIIGAAVSCKSIFSNPFLKKMTAFNSKLTWAYGSTSDCIAYLNTYMLYKTMKLNNEFHKFGGIKKWAESMFLELNALFELDKLVHEIKIRLSTEGISICEGVQRISWTNLEKTLILKTIIAGAFYPNYFIMSSRDEIDEREATKVLNGKDPRNTVYLTNMDNRQPGELYVSQVKNLFKDLNLNDIRVDFINNSRKILVSCPNISQPECLKRANIPGKVALFVYQAVKMRHLKIPLVLKVMPLEESLRKVNASNSVNRVINIEHCALENMSPRVPGIDESYISINLSFIQNCGHFWVHNVNDETQEELQLITKMLNSPKSALCDLKKMPIAGGVYAVPYKDNETSVIMYYRGRIDSILSKNSVWVYFIDYGNSATIPIAAIREFNPKFKKLLSIPPLSFECVLSEVAPSIIKDLRGVWTPAANTRFCNLINNKKLHGKIYSVVESVVHLELFANNVSVNDVLLKEGFAQVSEESYASKVNRDLRDRADNLQLAQIRAFNEEQLKQSSTSLSCLTPTYSECTEKICLRGPFSPLESNIYSIINAGQGKNVGIEWDSVNSVVLNNVNQDRNERLMVAVSVDESPSGEKLLIRNTTLMPNIPGLTELITLIFCPTAELFCNSNRDRYVGILCGLGHVDGRSVFPEHDIFVNINVDISDEDIKDINFFRYSMDIILKTSKDDNKPFNINPDQQLKALNSIKTIIEKLISRPRKQQEPTHIAKWQWNSPDQKFELINEDNKHMDNRVIFPPHSRKKLNPLNPKLLMSLAIENKKINNICNGSQSANGDEYKCIICGTGMISIPSLRLHLHSRMHRENIADLPPVDD